MTSYPDKIWDGDSRNRDSDRAPSKAPDARDWARMVAELAATQKQLDLRGDYKISHVAGGVLSAGDVLRVHTDGKIYTALAVANMGKIIGLCYQDTIPGDIVKVLTDGEITNSAWSLIVGDIYYLSAAVAGGITNVPPLATSQAIIPVGVALAPNKLAIDLRIRVKV